MIEEEKEQKIEEQRIAKEKKSEPINIAARYLRLLKRIVLGKKKPPKFLRVLCYINLGWGALMITGFGIVTLLLGLAIMDESNLAPMDTKYFIVYTCLHIVSFIGTIFMWRMKKLGFYLFSASTIIMPFLLFIMKHKWDKDFKIILPFSLIAIGLFAFNWKTLNLIKKKEKETT